MSQKDRTVTNDDGTEPRQRKHDFDPATWRCRVCTVSATSGIVVCVSPDEDPSLAHYHDPGEHVCFEHDGARVHGDPNMSVKAKAALSVLIEAAKQRMADEACRHCGSGPDPDGDHSCPCPYSDADCPNHPETASL